MINIKKQIIISAIILAAAGGSFLTANQVLAQGNTDFQSSIVQKIAEKFKLNKDDVQKVFDEQKVEHQKQRQAKFEENLNQAVKDGKIAEDQKKLILEKFTELQSKKQENFQNFKNKNIQERREAMQSHRQEMDKWAQDNGIDLKSLHNGFGMGKRGNWQGN